MTSWMFRYQSYESVVVLPLGSVMTVVFQSSQLYVVRYPSGVSMDSTQLLTAS